MLMTGAIGGPPRAKLEAMARDLNRKRYEKVRGQTTEWLGRFPQDPELWSLHGKACLGLGRARDAIASFGQVLMRRPDAPAALTDMGDALRAAGDAENAMTCYLRALQVAPQSFVARHGLGLLMLRSGRPEEAATWFAAAIEADPAQGIAQFNLAEARRQLGDAPGAMAHVERALALGFEAAEAHFLHGCLLSRSGRLDPSVAAFGKALARDPRHLKARVEKLYQMAQMVDWRWQDAFAAHLKGTPGIGSASPFPILAMEDDAAAQLARSRSHAAALFPARGASLAPRTRDAEGRISIGYFSSDFHEHATLHLMAGLFEAHDRSRFRICVYSWDTAPEDAARRRVMRSVCRFRDVSRLTDADTAALAREDGIDIAVDLKGYTGDTRLGILSHRAAPVQVSWLGYPGSLGTDFIDHIIADAVVIPPGYEEFYSENVLRLPGSYQVNDDRRPVPERAYARAELGLPEEGVVYCCFNASYKICPQVFAGWMEILQRTPGSVLWLLASNRWAEGNLKAAAERAGIDPTRLVFAERWPAPEHLARHRAADLFLDTLAYNAHTTASDALWAGVPVLTRIGEQFAARVGASLVSACGLPEMIVTTQQGYVDLAVALGQDPARLSALKDKLAAARGTAPLFDTAGFAAKLERLFEGLAAGDGAPPAVA